jgi:hypothetical protein
MNESESGLSMKIPVEELWLVPAHAKRAKVNPMATLQTDVLSSSAAIRARLNHPIVDSDRHQVEMAPVFLDYLAEVGGPSVAQRLKNGVAFDSFLNFEWRDLKPEERRERCAMKPVWWAGLTRNTRDLATSFFPNCCMNGWRSWGWTSRWSIRRSG